jgi:hypothetical protein
MNNQILGLSFGIRIDEMNILHNQVRGFFYEER